MENSIPADPKVYFANYFVKKKDLQHYMASIPPTPYQSKFSFSKLIKSVKTRNETLKNPGLEQIVAQLERANNELEQGKIKPGVDSQVKLEPIFRLVFPSFFLSGQMGFVKGPFENYPFRFQTTTFAEIMSNEQLEFKMTSQRSITPDLQDVLLAGISVLNTFYDQDIDIFSSQGMIMRDPSTTLERYFKFEAHLDYLEIIPIKPLKELNQKQIHELLSNPHDIDLWYRYIPPENFVFEGFIVGNIQETTSTEILSILKEMAANEGGKSGHEDDLNYLEVLLRSYLEMPEVQFGVLQTVHAPWIESVSWNLLRRVHSLSTDEALKDPNCFYGRVMATEKPVIVEDLSLVDNLSILENELLKKGIKSLLLAPLFDAEGKIVSVFEMASPLPYRFHTMILMKLGEFISLIEAGSNKFLQEMENSVQLTIQQEFTSIHSSVEWKFREVANTYFWQRIIEKQNCDVEPIVFKHVYPLYGQADIVGSSKIRNQSIRQDLTDNLERLYGLLVACRKVVHFHLFDIYAGQIKEHLDRFQSGAFASSDESVIVELLTEKVHPLLRNVRPRFPQLPQNELDAYFSYLDPELDIVYKDRKAYEDSVSLINQAISNYLLAEETKMQKILPHYFEKFQTDGVEYNLYLGQALLESTEFHPFYLRDFRLWQLISMCEITRLVEKKAKTFPVHLTTAQLIFVFNSSLSIRFRMDEKKFDIDGAYNVRYEIIKKRIDKAYIKGTDERLTQAGKIAIVWLQEKDRQEYQEYLDHLVRNQYISPDIEDHELDKMQGVQGLKAIRITVLV